MVILETAMKRHRNQPSGGQEESPWEGHPHFSPEAVAQRRATQERLRGRPGSPMTRLHP
jgi:hypothetical protein